MENFKILLFGISGLSMIFWVAVIGLWHVDMFPRIFAGEPTYGASPSSGNNSSIERGGLRQSSTNDGLLDRGKYSRKSFVIADFSPLEATYGVNRLYTSLLLSLGVMSFIVLGYGLHSGFILPT